MSKNGWREVVLGSLGKIVTGKTPKTKKPLNFGKDYMFVTPRDMDGQKHIYTTERKLSELGLNSVKNNNIPANTICVSCIGSDMGKVAITTKKSVTNQQINSIVVKDEDSNFIYYNLFLRQEEIKKGSSGSAVPIMNKTTFSNLPIKLPPLPIQKAIAKILGDLDAKIELNRKMNESLEAMAQALFQSWFVDFDPVLDNFLVKNDNNVEALPEPLRKKGALRLEVSKKNTSEINKLFPNSFVFNAVLRKWVPEGWALKSLDEVASYQNGLALQKFRPESENDEFLPVLKISHLKQGKTDGKEKARIDINQECIVDNGDVIFSWSASLQVDLWCGGKCALNQHLFKVTSKNYSKWFYYLYTKHHLDKFISIANDKAVTMGHIKREHLREAKCLIMSKELMCSADSIFKDLIEKQIKTKLETRNLTKLRDTLLPQLMSGKLEVPEAMLEIEKVLN